MTPPARFSLAEPLSALHHAREHGAALVVVDGETVLVVTRHRADRDVTGGDDEERAP